MRFPTSPGAQALSLVSQFPYRMTYTLMPPTRMLPPLLDTRDRGGWGHLEAERRAREEECTWEG